MTRIIDGAEAMVVVNGSLAVLGAVLAQGQVAPGLEAWLPFVGNVAGILVMAALQIGYQKQRDKDNAERIEAMVERVEKICEADREENNKRDDRSLMAFNEFRLQSRQTTEALFTINKEMAGAMAGVAQSQTALGQKVGELGSAIQQLSQRVDNIERPTRGTRG